MNPLQLIQRIEQLWKDRKFDKGKGFTEENPPIRTKKTFKIIMLAVDNKEERYIFSVHEYIEYRLLRKRLMGI